MHLTFLQRRCISLSLAMLLLTACGKKVGWVEEVKLPDGGVVKVVREVRHEGGGGEWAHGQGTVPREYVIRLPAASADSTVEWRSKKLDSSSYAELPLVLGRNARGKWTIFTALPLDPVCDQYFQYELRDGGWQEVPMNEDMPVLESNLLLGADSNTIKGFVSIADKAAELLSKGHRESLKSVGPKRFACPPAYQGPYPPVSLGMASGPLLWGDGIGGPRPIHGRTAHNEPGPVLQ